MSVALNHTIVWCSDKHRSSAFLADMFGLRPPKAFMHFMVASLDNGVTLDFMEKEAPISRQHYAFLVDDEGFDAVLGRIRAQGLAYWADPARLQSAEINHISAAAASIFKTPTVISSRRSRGRTRSADHGDTRRSRCSSAY